MFNLPLNKRRKKQGTSSQLRSGGGGERKYSYYNIICPNRITNPKKNSGLQIQKKKVDFEIIKFLSVVKLLIILTSVYNLERLMLMNGYYDTNDSCSRFVYIIQLYSV